MKKYSKKSFWSSAILSLTILLLVNSKSYSQTCPFAKPDLDSTISGTPVLVWIGANDSVGPTTPTPVVTITSGPSHGSVTIINGDSLIYTSNPGYVGNDFFFYTVCDTPSGCGCASSQVVILVRPIPCYPVIAVNDFSTLMLFPYSLVRFLDNDTSAAGQNITSTTILSGPNHGVANKINLDSLEYRPDSAYTGFDTIMYSACSSCGKCDTAFIYYTVLQRCNNPMAANDSAVGESGLAININPILNDLSDSVILSISIIGGPYHGSTTSSGSIIQYTSDSSYVGSDSVLYTICSLCGCDTAVIYLNIRERCIPPNAFDDLGATGYSSLCSHLFTISSNDVGNNLLTTIVSGPRSGVATVVGSNILYQSDSTLFGAYDTIRYAITNGCGSDTALLYIFVNATYPCNGFRPQIKNDSIRICRRDDSVIVNVTLNDIDPDGDPIKISSLIAPTNGTAYILNDSQIIYTPNSGFFGTDLFFYSGCDNGIPILCNSAQVFVTVDECRNPPHITDPLGNDIDTMVVNLFEDQDSTLCVPLYDIDGDNVSTSIVGIWENGTFTNITDTCIHLQPRLNSYGSDTVILIACDDRDTLCDTVVLIINIIPVNDPPTANPDIVVYPGNTVMIYPISNDTDIDVGDTISITLVINLNPNAGLTALNTDGSVSFTADSSFVGIDTIAYILCDNHGLCDTSAILVLVGPRANDDYTTAVLNTPISIKVLTNDVYSTNTVVAICGNPSNGSVAVVNNTITYTPNNGYTGNDRFCYIICDTATGLCDTAIVFIIVQNKTLFIPQGFSPNGDGINDFWNIESIENYPNAEVTVFNRWGDEIWVSGVNGYKNNATDAFAGNNKQNNPLPDATYYYVVKFNIDGVKNQAGFLQINR